MDRQREEIEAQRKEYEEKVNACGEIEKRLNTQHEEIEAQRKKYKEMEENLEASKGWRENWRHNVKR